MESSAQGEKKRKGLLGGFLILLALLALFILVVTIFPFNGGSKGKVFAKKGNQIGLVEVLGFIADAEDTVRQIKKYADDDSIKGILIKINSPGGGVGPSQEIHNELLAARQKKKVVSFMSTVGASGGYYIAVGADKVVANPGTITGSIGVIMGFMDMRSLMSKLGIKTIVVKSGEFKDIGSGSRPFTDADRKVLQEVIDDVYMQFVEAVAEGRGLSIEEVKKLADGRIYSGRQSKELGLIDQLGGFSDAVKLLGELAGIPGEPEIVREKEKYSWIKELLSSRLGSLLGAYRINASPSIYYLWTLG